VLKESNEKVFTEGKKVVGKAFLSKKRFLVKIRVISWLKIKGGAMPPITHPLT